MKLAEALAERAEAQTRLQQLRQRAIQGARIQEGDVPDEDPSALIAEAERLMERLQELITRVNVTNTATRYDDQWTITEAIAARDVCTQRHSFYADLAEAAAARQDRFTRSEVKFVAAIDVAAMRTAADAAAKRRREIDTRLQQLNWTTELL